MFLPATRFDVAATDLLRESATAAPAAPVGVDGGVVYYTEGGVLRAHDILKDEELWSAETDRPAVAEEDRPRHSASVVETAEGPVAIGAFETVVPAEGTTAAARQLEIIAVDAVSGRRLWHTTHVSESLRLSPLVLGVGEG